MRKQFWRNEGLKLEWPNIMAPAPSSEFIMVINDAVFKNVFAFQIYVFMYCVYICTCMYVRKYVCVCIYMCVCVYMYVHIYMHVYVYILIVYVN